MMNSFINDIQERSDKAEVWSKAVAYIRTHESRVRILTLINYENHLCFVSSDCNEVQRVNILVEQTKNAEC